MKREYGLDQITRDPASMVTVGTFDGVHRGHQVLIRYLIERARSHGGRSVVVSFDPHPREVVRGEAVPLLTTIDERAELCEQLGLDRFIVIPFTHAFSRLGAAEFVEQILVGRIGMQEVVVGYDHGFGHNREGGHALLEDLGRRLGFAVHVIPAQIVEQEVVSSTEIRRALEAGNVRTAAALLGRRYSFDGIVVEGDRRGRTIGFPTANLRPTHPRKILPRPGVYAVRVRLPEGGWWGGMMNLGQRPTFDGTGLRPEVHLFEFEGDLYGRQLRVEFVERLRDERRFASLEGLVEQLSRDRVRSLDVLDTVS
ncbi:MAG: bifunctional riboflavin kinase/FAD synthetase [Bacteroidetes bacterium]|nr:MAG: bifunctional riboflavin kinase/FAD synthetase [Bacteroidota bacterium]